MKKIYTFLCMLILSLSILAGCGSSESDNVTVESVSETIEETSEDSYIEDVEMEQESVSELKETIVEEKEEVTIEDIVEEEKPEFTYTDLSKTMYSTTKLNVRSIPDASGEKIGEFPEGEAVEVTGKCNESGWLRVKFGSVTGYVSASYMSDSKSVVEAPVPKEESQPKAESTPEPTPQAESSGGLCWKSATGEKYHSINNCGRMNPAKATQITISQAQSMGLEQCSKCW